MGCDIHALVERKIDDKWVMVDRLKRESRYRNYARFAALAGVRGNGPSPKGLPDDVSDSGMLHANEWGEDGHSHSYLPLKEAASIFLSTETCPTQYETKCPCSAFFDVEDCDADAHRLVFWFDN